ncbi:MAG: hypothetical protein IT294_02440 [Deltaproteobacteria bacterium]|nr:hypothetical protein [Deltaproteobacteria bacterium]
MAGPLEIPFHASFGVAVDLGRSGFKDLQREIRREARRALASAFKEMLGRIERALVARRVVCGACAVRMYSRGRSARRIVTAFGPIEVFRTRYRCRRCGATRRPLDEWLAIEADVTAMVREQALYLAADLPYDRAAEVLRHVGGIGISGRQIQRLLELESDRIEVALGGPRACAGGVKQRFRRAGNTDTSAGARRLLQLRRLRSSGLWDAYWSGRLDQREPQPPAAGRRDARRA